MDNKIEIVQGEGRRLYLGIQEDNGSPFDLTEMTAMQVWFKNTDGTYLELTYADGEIAVYGDATRGEVYVDITAAQSALLEVCNNADFQGDVTLTGEARRIIWENILTVKARRGS